MPSSRSSKRSSGSRPGRQQPATRRERRALERAATPIPPSRRFPPVLLITAIAVVVGLAAVGFLVLQNQAPVALASPTTTNPPALAHDRQLGSANAPVTLDVWSDFQCPYCLQFWTATEPSLVKTYIQTGEVRLVYHDFTFIGPESLDAAIAARCADQQGKFWPYHDLLYANQGKENSGAFSQSRLRQMATMVGLNMTKWTSCLSDPSISNAIKQETAKGQALGINGTPTLFVNGKKVSGFDFATVSAAIQAALPGASATPGASGATGTPVPSPSPTPSAAATSSP